MNGVKLLFVQYVNDEGELLPQYEVVADLVGAGVNEWVLITKGSAARQEQGFETKPLDALVVAIIDTVTVGNSRLYSKKDDFAS
jgi:carbon dioxide concentrating mechanism protein CcmL